jgi:hypothetical protein
MYLREIGWDGMDWIELDQNRDQWRALVNTVMNLRFLKIAGNFLNGCTIGSFSGSAHLRKYVCMYIIYREREKEREVLET